MLKALLVGIMLILTASFGVVAWLSLRPPPAPILKAEAPPPPPARVTILAASKQLEPGSLVKPEDIASLDVLATAVPEGARTDTPADRSTLIGGMVRRTLVAHQPLLSTDILRPTDGGFLAAVLAPGHRAVSVAVDAVSGTAGLIWPGDRVDLILTQALEEKSLPAGRRTFGETVLQDLRVIAVDQQLTTGARPDSTTARESNRTVTLEVLPAAAERVAVASRLGKIALSVRAAAIAAADPPAIPAEPAGPVTAATVGDRPAARVQTIAYGAARHSEPAQSTQAHSTQASPPGKSTLTTWGQDVSPALNQGRNDAVGATVRVFQGAANEKEFKFE